MTTKNTTNIVPPGNLGLPIIGETISFLRDPDFANKRTQKYGSIFKTSIFGQPTIVIGDPEANRFLLSNENKYFTVNWPQSTKILLGSSSLSMQGGELHKSRRKLLAKAFQPRVLAGYVSTVETISQRYFKKWLGLGQFQWYPELRNYTFDVACKLFVGKDAASETNMGQLFEDWCGGLFTIPLRLPGTKFNRAFHCRKQLLKEIEILIRQRQQQSEPGEDALGLLLNAQDDEGNQFSIEELRDQILTLLFAGHETLTSALTSTVLLLAQNSEILAKARAEQKQIQLQYPLSLDQLKPMVYLDQILKEVLRKIPPVGGGFREVIQPCEFRGYSFPKGWSVLYQIGKAHGNAEIYNHPEQFNPDRFHPDSSEEKPYSYIPFGGGMRECLGKEFAKLEMKLFTALLLREYEWELLPNQNLDLTVAPTPHPKDGLQINFHSMASFTTLS